MPFLTSHSIWVWIVLLWLVHPRLDDRPCPTQPSLCSQLYLHIVSERKNDWHRSLLVLLHIPDPASIQTRFYLQLLLWAPPGAPPDNLQCPGGDRPSPPEDELQPACVSWGGTAQGAPLVPSWWCAACLHQQDRKDTCGWVVTGNTALLKSPLLSNS